MNFRWPFLFALLLLNSLAYAALRAALGLRIREEGRLRSARRWLIAVLVVLNLPLCVFMSERLNAALLKVPTVTLAVVFYPSTAWLATLIAFGVLAGPVCAGFFVARRLRRLRLKQRQKKAAARAAPEDLRAQDFGLRDSPPPESEATCVSRRRFMAAGGLLIPGIYAVACYGSYGNLNELEISAERRIPISNLPRSLDGMTIVQVSDLHAGAYIREAELRFLVERINALKPDLIALTGDILDLTLASLPGAVRGLRGLQAPLGTLAVLGNHDLYADQHSFDREHRGGVRIVEGMQTVGIRTLRNEVAYLGDGAEKLAMLGLDWLSPNPYQPNFYQYRAAETAAELRQMSGQVPPGTPKVLLAHHPDTFQDVGPFQIALTLSGHTHGGGQIILGHLGGVPLGVGLLRFKYLSGLYQENGSTLYVNRGIGYLGIPIRINCPPEISRFRLVRSSIA